MASLYVGNLTLEVSEEMLYDKFKPAGVILSIQVSRDQISGRSLGYAFIDFKQLADAKRAMATLNLVEIQGRPMHIRCMEPKPTWTKDAEVRIFVKNLEESINSVALYRMLSEFGTILSCKVACNADNGSKGYGFVQFKTQGEAERAIEKINGVLYNGKKIVVDHLKTYKEHEAEEDGQAKKKVGQQGVNLFVKNLGSEIDDERLRKLFSPFGTINRAKVILSGGHSKGYGFVRYCSPEEADNAMATMQGHIVANRPLYVALDQRKEERHVHQSSQHVHAGQESVSPNQMVLSSPGLHWAKKSERSHPTKNTGSCPATTAAATATLLQLVDQPKVDARVNNTKQHMTTESEAIKQQQVDALAADLWTTVSKKRGRKKH